MRIALIEPGSPGLDIYSHILMGRGVVLLATILKDLGHDVKCFVEDVGGEESLDEEFLSKAEIVGFSSITCTLPRAKVLVDKVKSVNPEATIIFGGPEPTCAPERSLSIGADFVVRGEGEKALPELLEALEGKRSFPEIDGLSWTRDGKTIHNKDRLQLVTDELNQLPFADWFLVPGGEKRNVGAVWRSRGCPMRCEFCEVHEIWPKYVLRDEEISGEEFRSTDRETIFLIDDNVAAKKDSFKKFLHLAIKNSYSKILVVQMRADALLTKDNKVDRPFIRLLKKASSFIIVCIGIETTDDASLEKMSKGINFRRTKKAVKALMRSGIAVLGMIISQATDTLSVIKNNGRFSRKYLSILQYLHEVPLPGTKQTQRHVDEGRILLDSFDDLALHNGMHVVLKPDHMSPLQMHQAVLREYRKFYSKWRIFTAFTNGLLFRWRLINDGQKRYLRELPAGKRFLQWVQYHLIWKFGIWSLRRIARKRVENFCSDPAYRKYLDRLERASTQITENGSFGGKSQTLTRCQ